MSRGLSRERVSIELARSRRSLAVLGVLAAVSVATAVLMASKLDVRLPGSRQLTFHVEVRSAFGVDAGRTRVTVAGVPAGTITAAKLAGGRAVLTVSVRRSFGPIYRDARLALRPHSQLQDMALDVTSRGTAAAGTVHAADVLPGVQTHTTVPVSEVLDLFGSPTRQRLAVLLQQLGAGLQDRGASMRQAFAQLAPFLVEAGRLSRVIAARDRLTRRLVHNARLMFGELGTREAQLASLTANASRTLTATASERAALGDALEQLPGTLATLRDTFAVLRGSLGHVDPALSELRAPVAQLPAALRSLRHVATAANPVISQLSPSVSALAPAVRALQPVARDLDTTMTALSPQIPRLDKVTRDVIPCRDAINKFFQNTVSFYKFTSVPGPVGRSELIFGSGSALGAASPTAFVPTMCYDAAGSAP